MMKKPCIVLFAGFFLIYTQAPLCAYTGYTKAPEYLCELGIKFYNQGRYDEALHEFKRALVAYPDYPLAQKYIDLIEGRVPEETTALKPFEWGGVESRVFETPEITPEPEIKGPLPPPIKPSFKEREVKEPPLKPEIAPKEKAVKKTVPNAVAPQKVEPISALRLDESLKSLPQPINLEQGRRIIVSGKNIQRFLVTQPGVITVEKNGLDELLLTAKEIGYTYVHIWDDNGRWTLEFLTVFPKPEGLTYEEQLQELERGRNFRLRYTLDWSAFESGDSIRRLERSSYYWGHYLRLDGDTPYGNLDSALSVRRLNRLNPDVTYFTFGLSEGKWGPFKGFSLRGFDFSPYFSNMAFPGATLRGGVLGSPAFNNKLHYSAFWGREGGGRYGNLSPNLTKARHSFLEGFNANYSLTKRQNYEFSIVHGWGRNRDKDLNSNSYDLIGRWNLDKWLATYEIANDSETFAHLFNTRYIRPNLTFNAELRDVDKDFKSITGKGWRAGELGGTFNLRHNLTDKIAMTSYLNVYQNKLFPAEEDNDRLNEDFNWNTDFRMNPKTSFSLNYSLQNNLGSLSQYRNQGAGAGISKTFKIIKDISTFANYSHQESKNFSTPSANYISDRLYSGLRFSIIGNLNYYLNKDITLVRERFNDAKNHPHALETGLDWYGKFGKTPFGGNFRFTYRDEESTVSDLGFLSGEDYIEGYSELSYKPSEGTEIYGSSRVRNVWAENPRASSRIEASFNAGMRYLWNTGLRWESVGNIEGYIFKDFNSDGLRQRDEPPLEGIKVWLGRDKSLVTDLFGYYKFKGVRARKAFISFDASSLPAGYVLTVPMMQEVAIAHNQTVRLDFGIVSRSEISGYIFEDKDGDGEFGASDEGVKGVIVTLEDGKKTATDGSGRYSFANVSTGEHTISIDLNTIPVFYLPQAALKKEITLFEGVTYLYNVPLKKIQQ